MERKTKEAYIEAFSRLKEVIGDNLIESVMTDYEAALRSAIAFVFPFWAAGFIFRGRSLKKQGSWV